MPNLGIHKKPQPEVKQRRPSGKGEWINDSIKSVRPRRESPSSPSSSFYPTGSIKEAKTLDEIRAEDPNPRPIIPWMAARKPKNPDLIEP